MDVLDLLLNADNPKLPEQEIKIKRLSKEIGKDVLFKIKALKYDRVEEIKKLHSERDMNVHILLAGVISPNLKSEELRAKYNAPTAADTIKALLLPGEIEDISRAIEKLSGFRTTNIEEVKKK